MTGKPKSLTLLSAGGRVWLPAVMLCSVAIVQIFLAKTASLSPWKGGGFGMFSSLDGTAFRRVRIFVQAPGRDEELEISPSQERLAARAELFPSDSKLHKLAIAVASREKRYSRDVTTVRIEVWRADFNEYLEATDRPLRAFTWNVDQPPDNIR
ncbi:MAG: hypothetical protein H7070_00340 [Saprospiraceae bacterium]|nr:hypothetical protein [Pyrinomonadaceae bacterium]